MSSEDTIAAIATPIGKAGIGVIRISGGDSIRVTACVFSRPIDDVPSHTVHLGIAKDPRTGEPIDEVLLTLFRSPKSYTGEDVVEISCHGGTAVARRLLEAVISAGARHAEPGEFTKRAFLNGRMDLAQAEAVNDLIKASTDEARKVALRQVEGGLSAEVKAASSELAGVLAEIEASVDFPDDVEEPQSASLRERISAVVERLERLLASADRGRVYREGVVVTIAGKPNVGKSSLLNALLRESRAIVTPIPGTTRDTIEETVNIRGVPVVAIDTAGLRETPDTIERVGVQRAEDAIERAHVLLMVADARQADDLQLPEDKPARLGGDFPIATSKLKRDFRIPQDKPAILVLNKIDLLSAEDAGRAVEATQGRFGAGVVAAVSALTGEGIGELEDRIAEIALSGVVDASENVLVSNARHKSALERTVAGLRRADQTVEQRLPVDLVSVDLMAARNALGEITGETATEDLIDRIFSEFCIGK